MLVTIDTSAVLAVILNEADKERLVQHTQGFDLIAPRSLHAEIGNALSSGFKRGRYALPEAIMALNAYKRIPIQLTETPLDEAIGLAFAMDIYAYDAYMLLCARNHRCPLLTLDQHMARVAIQAGIEIVEVTS